jgi:excisionase family DNA binding protein
VEFTTIREACARLRVHRTSLERLFKNGELTKVKVGRAVRIRTADLDAYLERNSQHGASESDLVCSDRVA